MCFGIPTVAVQPAGWKAVYGRGVFESDRRRRRELRVPLCASVRKRLPMYAQPFALQLGQTDPPDQRGGAGEVAIHQVLAQSQSLEGLRAPVAAQGRHAHLAHDLEQSFLHGRDVPVDCLLDRQVAGHPTGRLKVRDALENQIRVDAARTEPHQGGEVMHLSRLAGLHGQTAQVALAPADQVMVSGADGEQTRDRRSLGADAPVAENDQGVALVDAGLDLLTKLPQCLFQGSRDPRRVKQDRHGADTKIPTRRAPQHLDVIVGQDRVRELELAAVFRGLVEEVPLPAHKAHQTHHQVFPVRIDRRVGHLGEELLEVAEQQLGPQREHRRRRVVAHGAHRLLGVFDHRSHDRLEILAGVAESPLGRRHCFPFDGHGAGSAEQSLELDAVLLQPVPVGPPPGYGGLDLAVLDDPALPRVDHEHLSRGQTAFFQDLRRIQVQHADLGGQDDPSTPGDHVPPGAQTVPVEHRPDTHAVTERDRRRAVPGLHDGGVVLEEGPLVLRNMIAAAEGLRDHHDQGMLETAPPPDQELQHVVEDRRIAQGRVDHRTDRLDPVGEQLGSQSALPGPHVVDVPPQGVDFAIVGDQAEGLSQVPGREGVGAVALVEQGHGAEEVLLAQVRIERQELG